MDQPRRLVLLFVDGLGWGPVAAAANPTQTYGGDRLRLPDPPADGRPLPRPDGGWARPIDACLGMPGLPQSATGQTTLLTGVNAAASLGHHKEGFPGPHLRGILLEHSIMKRLVERGRRPVFFNTFRSPFFSWPRERQLRMSATTVATLAADLPFFDVPDIAAGLSIYQEFTNAELRALGYDAPLLTPEEAGAILASQVPHYDFLLYEYFQTDKAGHATERARAERELRRLDAFIGAVLAGIADDALVLLCSDHGNIEDLAVRTHTCHPVPLLAWGPGAHAFVDDVTSLVDVVPAIMARFGG